MDQTIYYNSNITKRLQNIRETITIYIKNNLRHWEVRFPNSERPRDAIRYLDSTNCRRPVAAVFLHSDRGATGLVTDNCGPSPLNSAHDFPQDQRGPFILRSALHQPTGSLNYTKSRNEVQRRNRYHDMA